MTSPPSPPGGGAAGSRDDGAVWHRLHPLSPVIRAGRQFVTIAIAVLVLFVANQHHADNDLVIDLIVLGVVLVGGVISWLVTRWQVAGGVLRIDTGLLRRESRRFPLSQVQAIDVIQTGLARVLGLAEIRLRMAGAGASEGRLACLPRAEAEQLRERLLSMSRAPGLAAAGTPAARPGTGSAAGGSAPPGRATRQDAAPQGAAPQGTAGQSATGQQAGAGAQASERQLFRVRAGRLAASIAASRAGAFAAIVIGAMAAVVATTGKPGILASFLPFGLGIVLAVWRQFNGEYGTVIAAAPDGLRLRSGLVETTAETIRPGRVQAVRLVQPLVWRAFGWCRLEVDVAGPRQRRENKSESQRLRAVIPVGSLAEADQLLGELLTARPAPTRRAPAGARWKAPLTYHFLGWDGDDRYVVASRGRVCRKTTWVPLEKVQSFRWVQGPVQRRLGLASVHLDVAGKRVAASIEDRGAAEARDILGRLPALARAARSRG
ncbi:MAG TPA: PH domain-containing protein [Streptosporangiaceae bacterium]